jgi:trk system potassium uptake protein TrkH
LEKHSKNRVVLTPRNSEISSINFKIKERKSTFRGPSSLMLVIYGFLGVILLGTLLLYFPVSHAENVSVTFVEALFTATSAVTVTGLVVLDSASTWSFFGELTIILLILIGGLGITTSAAFLIVIMGQKVGFQNLLLIREEIRSQGLSNLGSLVVNVVILTLIIQIIGAIVFFVAFSIFISELDKLSVGQLVWLSIFHSISAFNNAGFDILSAFGSESATIFKYKPLILTIFSSLIITGGLGYFVLHDLVHHRRVGKFRFRLKLFLETRLIILGYLVLIILGFLFVFIGEFSNPNTIGNMDLGNKIYNSFFSSITSRSAGFSTFNYGETTGFTLLVTEILMFIGGAPASPAGGIKITTFVVIVLAVFSYLRGRRNVVIWRRQIPQQTINHSVVIIMFFGFMVLVFIFFITLLNNGLQFDKIVFEVISSFTTTGLSTGITSEVSVLSKYLLIIAMFFGRLSSLVLVFLLTNSKEPNYNLLEEKIRIG